MAAATGNGIHATSPRDSLTGVAARSVPVTRTHPLPLPTPPNSISPALPPHGLKAQLQKAGGRLDPIDSDLDLQDADGDSGYRASSTDSANSGVAALAAAAAAAAATAGVGSPPYESADAITPVILARYHLPEILLNHGPLAIRYIIGHLTASVPGFSTIPPAKSRRLVVAALEGRGNGIEGGVGGMEGDVEFQKVSWGVWGARRLGSSGRSHKLPTRPRPSSLGIPITSGSSSNEDAAVSSTWGGSDRLRQQSEESAAVRQTDHDDVSMMDNEVDNMSMDDDDDSSASASCSEAPDEDMDMNDDPENLTDEEDWGAVGAAALRAASYSNSGTASRFGSSSMLSRRPYGSIDFAANFGTQRRSFSSNVGAAGAARAQKQPSFALDRFANFQGASDEQEREAVEALLRLGSV